MHFSSDENKKKSKDKISQHISEIETISLNIQEERAKVQRLTDELLKEGVELIKVSEKLTSVGSMLEGEKEQLKQPQSKEPVPIRKDHFPYDPQEYVTGAYRLSEFSHTKSFSPNETETKTNESLGPRKSRKKGLTISKGNSNSLSVKNKKKKRRNVKPFLPVFVFICVFLVLLLVLDFYNPYIFPFIDTKDFVDFLIKNLNIGSIL